MSNHATPSPRILKKMQSWFFFLKYSWLSQTFSWIFFFQIWIFFSKFEFFFQIWIWIQKKFNLTKLYYKFCMKCEKILYHHSERTIFILSQCVKAKFRREKRYFNIICKVLLNLQNPTMINKTRVCAWNVDIYFPLNAQKVRANIENVWCSFHIFTMEYYNIHRKCWFGHFVYINFDVFMFIQNNLF